MALSPGGVLELTIEKGVYRGLGLARHEGQVVFVPRGLPGDRLRVRVGSLSRGYVRAAIEEPLAPGPGRRASPCPFFARCGGCAYQELGYAEQLRLKEQILRESLERAGVPWEGEIRLRGSPEEAWRTRASFHLQMREGELRLGLREEGTHRVVDLPRCLQISDPMNRAFRGLLAGLAERPGVARRIHDVDLAESFDGGRLVASLEGDLTVQQAAALASLVRWAPGLTGLGAVLGQRGGRRFVSLHGEPYVGATVLGIHLRSHVRSFFQANRFLAGELAQEVLELTAPGGRVLDLYAGVGLFALPLATRAEEMLAVEINPTAVEDAEANARQAGLGRLRVRRGDVLEALASWPVHRGERVVLDPPRSGAGTEVVKAIALRAPGSVVYVSCDPPTLGRDLKTFAEAGYRPDVVRAFDLFPDTFHLETIVRLGR